MKDNKRDISKLPLWAQREIVRLRADLEDATKTLAAGPEDSNTFADPYFGWEPGRSEKGGRPLGHDTMVEFRMESGGYFHVQIKSQGGEEYLDVYHAEGPRRSTPAVFPRSSNTFEVREVPG